MNKTTHTLSHVYRRKAKVNNSNLIEHISEEESEQLQAQLDEAKNYRNRGQIPLQGFRTYREEEQEETRFNLHFSCKDR